MNAKDVMTAHVITVRPETSVTEVAETLISRRISAVPVVDGTGRLAGIVSEGDLIRRPETGTDVRHRSWWLGMLTSGQAAAAEYVKSHGLTAADVMTRGVVTVGEDTPLAEIAETLETRHIKRVPVVRDGKVVGIVSRANLVQALATLRGATPRRAEADAEIRNGLLTLVASLTQPQPVPDRPAIDAKIREDLLSQLEGEDWPDLGWTGVTVTAGVVELWGFTQSESDRRAWQIAAGAVPGVKKVIDHRSARPAVIDAY
jgi:CBS domain-containing protein